MSIKKTLAQLLVFAILEVGALGGVPMNPEKIRRLMQVMHDTKAEYVVKNETDDDPNLAQLSQENSDEVNE
ncbi:MAG TPA: hypothetical protein VFM36_00195 [Thermoanaerobaculia bacterium]|nr:hypothetical protein [Thermoanaerobaculia bacterium]